MMAVLRRSHITARQHAVLHVVEQHGPVTGSEVHYHGFTVSAEAARASLSRLEARKFVDAHYTGGSRGRAYVITPRGSEALAAYDGERMADEEDDDA